MQSPRPKKNKSERADPPRSRLLWQVKANAHREFVQDLVSLGLDSGLIEKHLHTAELCDRIAADKKLGRPKDEPIANQLLVQSKLWKNLATERQQTEKLSTQDRDLQIFSAMQKRIADSGCTSEEAAEWLKGQKTQLTLKTTSSGKPKEITSDTLRRIYFRVSKTQKN